MHLRCEYLVSPLGIEVKVPRLSWQMRSEKRGAQQTAYRILVASSSEKLTRNLCDLWDSKKVTSDASIQVVYAGAPMTSRLHCFWKVMESGKQLSKTAGVKFLRNEKDRIVLRVTAGHYEFVAK
jgi:hypothetical protein